MFKYLLVRYVCLQTYVKILKVYCEFVMYSVFGLSLV